MTSSSSSAPVLERGVDTMRIVYGLLQGHHACTPCEPFLRALAGWFTSSLALVEANAVLTKVYGVDPAAATHKVLESLAAGIALLAADLPEVRTIMETVGVGLWFDPDDPGSIAIAICPGVLNEPIQRRCRNNNRPALAELDPDREGQKRVRIYQDMVQSPQKAERLLSKEASPCVA